MTFITAIRAALADSRGISAVEYGILIGVVGVALATVLGGVGGDIGDYITNSIAALTTAGGEN
jgi:Flp pilus assembly pilin Flp